MPQKNNVNRRTFLRSTALTAVGALGFPAIVPSSVLGRNGAVLPGNKITIGCIGVGWQGTSNLEGFLEEPDAHVVAVCDLDTKHLQEAKALIDKKYGNNDCATYHDFRELLTRQDIDAISIGTPDHWHSIPAIASARAGKDIYGEKPLSHTIKEGRAMCDAVKRYNRIWQTGSWQRSEAPFRYACELVLNGRIGKVHTVQVGLPSGHTDFAGTRNLNTITPPPPELDYEFWLGPAPYSPYVTARVHKNWRWVLDFGGGQIMDWVGHHVDIAHWGLGMDYAAPIEVEGQGEYPKNGIWNTATKYRVETKYANGIKMTLAGGYNNIRSGTKWIGDLGWVWVDRSGIDAEPKSLLKETFAPGEIHLLQSGGHYRNFLDCVKSREATLTPCEVAHHSAIPGHLGQISMLLGRKIYFNPETEEIINDPTASRMLGKSMRSPWQL
ncbi:MAG TPA: Gfo/Idh/MocA family oxidoreductase [bacterium]|nr:Gfo/Idh/MocA family oxidoreductase [bacterium]HPN45062.1 Gfo/Idh/MocA family oxidoreductase [bacterium]